MYMVLTRDPLSLYGIETVDYLKEAYKQLNVKEVYKQVPDDLNVLLNWSISKNAPAGWFVERQFLIIFWLKILNLQGFLPKIYKRLRDVPGRLILKCG